MIRSAKKAHSWILCVHQYPAFLTGSSTDRRLCKKRSFKAETPYVPSKTISRVMSCVIIYPMELSPVPLSDPPENMTGSHIRFLFGLASDGVYMCPLCYQRGGSLLHCLSTLTGKPAVYFCCTGLGVASTGRYPASCPVKPGLSSPA